MAITVEEAYQRGDEALANHADDDDLGFDAAKAYVHDILGISGEEFAAGVQLELAGAIETLEREGLGYLAPILFSSFVAGVEWQRERGQ